MAISKARKEELVAQYTDILSGSDGFVIVQSRGMTVKQAQELRAKIRETEGQYLVTKNTLFRIALKNAGWTIPEELIQGPVAIAFTSGNFPGLAKAILKFIKDERLEENARITGGILNKEVLDDSEIGGISRLPSLDRLRSQLADSSSNLLPGWSVCSTRQRGRSSTSWMLMSGKIPKAMPLEICRIIR